MLACGEPGGGDDPATATETQASTSSVDTQMSSAGTEPPGPCGDGFCAQPPPEGWFGPIAKFEHDGTGTPPACGGAWPDAAFSLFGGYADPGPASCGTCECAVNTRALCRLTGYRTEGSDVCEYDDFFAIGRPDTCEPLVVDDGSVWIYAFTDGTPVCSPEAESTIPDVQWAAHVSGCRGAEYGEACDDAGRACLPPPPGGFGDDLCIFANGDLPCPDGDYTERTLLYSGTEDTRACTACACANVEGSCTGTFEFFADDDCSGTPQATPDANAGCVGATVDLHAVRFAYDGPTSCAVKEPAEPIGTVAPSGELTYCCRA